MSGWSRAMCGLSLRVRVRDVDLKLLSCSKLSRRCHSSHQRRTGICRLSRNRLQGA